MQIWCWTRRYASIVVTSGSHTVAFLAETLNLTAPRWCKVPGDPPSRTLNLEIDFLRFDRLGEPPETPGREMSCAGDKEPQRPRDIWSLEALVPIAPLLEAAVRSNR